MKRRIVTNLTPDQVKTLNDSAAAIKAIYYDLLLNADLDALEGGQSMGTGGGWDYCQKGIDIVKDYPTLADPEMLDPVIYAANADSAGQILEFQEELETIQELSTISFRLYGKELMDDTTHLRNQANTKKAKVLKYVQPSNELNEMYEKRAEKAQETKKQNSIIATLKAEAEAWKAQTEALKAEAEANKPAAEAPNTAK